MSQNRWKLRSCLSLFALVSAVAPLVKAQCRPSLPSVKPMSWSASRPGADLHLVSAVQDVGTSGTPGTSKDSQSAPTIVGMWHVLLVAKTMNGSAIPDTTIDNSLVVWHADGTEIMNSGRPPQDGNFCLGVWEQTDPLSYRLNHFAWAANSYTPGSPDGMIGSPIGPVHYQETVLLGPGGKHYGGIFTLDEYDTAGHVLVSFTGMIKATRVTVNTSTADLL